MNITKSNSKFFERAIELALNAESNGNLPIGAVITSDGELTAAGQNSIWHPDFNPNRHAEIEALCNVPQHFWPYASKMTLYTTLEPCLMCMGAILLHYIGCLVNGAVDDMDGASQVTGTRLQPSKK